MKKWKVAAAVVLTGSMMNLTAFAGQWAYNSQGWWYSTKSDGTDWYKNEWQWIDGNCDGTAECYYFNADGYMLANTATPDGYTVNTDGAWVENGVVQTKASGNAASNVTTGTVHIPDMEETMDTSDTEEETEDMSDAETESRTALHAAAKTTAARKKSKTRKKTLLSDSSTDIQWGDVQVIEPEEDGTETVFQSDTETGETLTKSESESNSEKDFSDYARKCFDLINEKRKANGVDELEWNDTIAEACDTRAQELAERFSHLRPDGTICFTAFDEVGLDTPAEGENIACGQATPKLAVNAWMKSKGHRENILKEGYTDSAIGFYYDEDKNEYYWVQMFGRPRNK